MLSSNVFISILDEDSWEVDDLLGLAPPYIVESYSNSVGFLQTLENYHFGLFITLGFKKLLANACPFVNRFI